MSLAKKINTGLRHPFSFVWRQLYKVCMVYPYQAVVWCVQKAQRAITTSAVSGTDQVCVIMTSLISTASTPLSYGTRSVFSAAERADQTRQSIASVRSLLPGAHLVFVEAGMSGAVPADIISSVDTYVYVGTSWWVRAAVNSRFKSLGETCMLLAAYRSLPQAQQYFKMSGRYALTPSFAASSWSGGLFHFYYIRPDFVSTRLYSFSYAAKRDWRMALIKSVPLLFLDYPIEFLLPKYINLRSITHASSVGIQGFDAVSGVPVSE